MKTNEIINRLYRQNQIDGEELLCLLDDENDETLVNLMTKANEKRVERYGKTVYLRGLIEFTNYCKQNCLYCGIRSGNGKAQRYRLSAKEIIAVCNTGWELGYRTFVLQGGEDNFYSDEEMVEIITILKKKFTGCAITLSIGEKLRESYQMFFKAGADRYLLRQETVSESLYQKLHPGMKLENRLRCLYDLKEIGYQVGAGFMVGLPGQSNHDFVKDLLFLKEFQPHMVGIGPFMPHKDTPLADSQPGTVETTLKMLAITRLLLPDALIPATTALGSLNPLGREKGLKAGANVVMPNLSPIEVRNKYALYDGKISNGEEAAECKRSIESRINKAGYTVDMSRGDHPDFGLAKMENNHFKH